jgi:uncharacterized membrane protein YhaH (DUF805 family)
MRSYAELWRRFFGFTGRSTRGRFWTAVLVHFVVLAGLLALTSVTEHAVWLFSPYYLITIVPLVAMQVRRLHDGGNSGWWLLLSLVPLGGIAVIVFLALPGTVGTNRFGPDPRELDGVPQDQFGTGAWPASSSWSDRG